VRIVFWHSDRRTVLKGLFATFILILFAAILLELLSPHGYKVSNGTIYFELDRPHSWTGKVNILLGPAGSLQYKTHKTPFDINVTYVVDGDQSVTSPKFIDSLQNIQPEGMVTVKSFFIWRIPWVIALGALAGMIVGMMLSSGNGFHWMKKASKYCLTGIAYSGTFVAIVVGVTFFTIDHTPTKEYFGQATNFAEASSLVTKVNSNKAYQNDGIENFIKGLGVVSLQMENLARRQEAETTRILFLSDVHDNAMGVRLAKKIITTGQFGHIASILFAGDTTNLGSAWEAGLITKILLGEIVPVYFVGGNHESMPAMKAFIAAGYRNLSGQEVIVDDVGIFGDNDPSAYLDQVVPADEDLVLAQSSATLLAIWDTYEDKPDLLLVHNLKQAEGIIEETKKNKGNLVVVYGHDHKASVKKDEGITLVDVGSSGASGFGEVGYNPESPYAFQIVEFTTAGTVELYSVTTITFNGVGKTVDIKYEPMIE
jgi:predicted phosphodiesterase